ncbi:MAG: hypothetical protein U0520_01805 [Candidatus Saccharimonadales bacterium]
MKVYADQGVDQRKLRTLKNQYGFDIVQAHDIEQNISVAKNVPHPFVLGISLLDGGDYLAGDDINEIGKVIGGTTVGKNGGTDTLHVYTAHKEGCQYFITNNSADFIYTSRRDKTNGKRQKLEEILRGMKIVTLDEFEKALSV